MIGVEYSRYLRPESQARFDISRKFVVLLATTAGRGVPEACSV